MVVRETQDQTSPRLSLRDFNLRPLIVLSSLALVLVAGIAALLLAEGVSRQLDDVLRTHQLRQYARDLTLALAEAEAGQRGYLLTLDVQHLERYNTAIAQVDESVASLVEATADSPSQHARVTSLLDLINTRTEALSDAVAIAASGRVDQARTLSNSAAGNALMADIRSTIAAFVGREDQLLVDRNMQVHQLRTSLVIAILAALAGAAILAYVLLSGSRREVLDLARIRFALLNENEELDARVRARTEELEEARAHADRERARVETMLQDTNHRIGNSLATVSSLLALQQMRTKSEEVRNALEAARGRVHAIASAHRRLRLGDDFETMRADEFLAQVIEDLRATQSGLDRISFETDFAPLVIRARDATTIGIILGELVTNALKHAFPDGRKGAVRVSLRQGEGGVALLSVEDDGAGLPADAGEGGGLGQVIVKQLAMQFGGEPRFTRPEAGGTSVTIAMPILVSDQAGRSNGAEQHQGT